MLYVSALFRKFSFYLSLIFVVFLAACSHSKNADLLAEQAHVDAPDVLYNQALANLNLGRYHEAVAKFSTIETQNPSTPWERKALAMEVFINYKLAKYQDAADCASRFLQQYPKSSTAGYINYLQGMSYFKQIPDISFDQKAAQDTIDSFNNLLKNYPKSTYCTDAKNKIRFAKAQLAEKEMRVGRYYQSQRNFVAALKRYRYVLEHYSDSLLTEEALYRCVEVNEALGLTVEARTAAYILGYNFPRSLWYQRAFKLLDDKSVSPQRAKDSWLYKIYKH